MLEIITMCYLPPSKWNKEQSDQSSSPLRLHGNAEEAEGAYKFIIPYIKDQTSQVLLCSTAHKLLYRGILMRPDEPMKTGRR